MDTPHDCESVEEIKAALQKNNQALAMEKIKEYVDKQNNIPLNIAITGETGSGKSTFINAFRGVKHGDAGYAPTGVRECTKVPTPYTHPNYPNVKLWDLPGVGGKHFPADQYLNDVGFENYDFFIIISDTRFRENDVKLAREIQRMKKKFYFVRSKIDNDIRAQKLCQSEFSEAEIKEQIKEDCIKCLQEQGIQSPQVFLVSSFELHLHDFSLFIETLERELPEHKRNALLFAMPNINQQIINKKKEAFQANIKWYAALSAAVAAVPLPGLSVGVDAALLAHVAKQYAVSFGLDVPSLENLAKSTGVPFKDFMASILSPLAATKITPDLIIKVLTQCASAAALMAAEEGSRFIPFLGIPAAMALSFTTTYRMLNFILNELADDAQRVFEKALGCNTTE
ncbi:interferon-inducible GTPase 5-like [Acanthopagrus latus]|uniref:interferon-inducible GTPase 5-like n=1 Tax=Acanthopagrus latus TaxID=8177 RepID=UPI00187C0FCF|nr:interferon-inducible GTPase 5-like [Acanthopagrus latus]